MVPADKVVCCDPKNTIRKVMDTMLEKKIGVVVVVKDNVPLGIISKTDIMKAYKDNLTLDHALLPFAPCPILRPVVIKMGKKPDPQRDLPTRGRRPPEISTM